MIIYTKTDRESNSITLGSRSCSPLPESIERWWIWSAAHQARVKSVLWLKLVGCVDF